MELDSGCYRLPVLDRLLALLPLAVRCWHSDSGCESVDYHVAPILEKLCAERFTKSSRRSNDILAGIKNGSVIRKQFGYGRISGATLGPPTASTARCWTSTGLPPDMPIPDRGNGYRGKQFKAYRQVVILMPYERLEALPEAVRHLKSKGSFPVLPEVD